MMQKSKTTKRHVLVSAVLIMVMCISVMVGGTYAWFTDTASTSVNRIQAGKLNVALYYKDMEGEWQDAEGGTLGWVQKIAPNGEVSQIVEDDGLPLWEPGCTFVLPDLKIVNEGNLAFKYTVEIGGMIGDEGLGKVIDFTIEIGDSDAATLENFDGILLPEGKAATEGTKEEVYETSPITISGHMREEAGNEYQGLSIEEIYITVYATQYTYEYDSNDNQYDVSAMYPLMPKVDVDLAKAASVNENSELTADVKMSASTIPAGTVLYTSHDKNSESQLTNVAIEGSLKEDIKTTSASANEMTVSINYTYKQEGEDDLEIKAFSTPITHTLSLSKGLKSVTVTHGGENMILAESADALEDGQYHYNKETGMLKIKSSTYSDFKVMIEHGFVASTDGQGYATFAEAIEAVKDGGVVQLLDNITLNETTEFNKSLTLDLNGQTLTVDVTGKSTDGFVVNSGAELILANSVADHGIFCFISNSTRNDGIYVYNTEADKTASLVVKNPVHIEMDGNFNSAIHAYASAGESKLTIEDGTLIDITTTAQMKAVQLDQNSTGTMNGGEIRMTGEFEKYSTNNDTVGVLIHGANGKQDSIHFVMNGGKLAVGGKNAFAQGIQVGMVNGYSENVDVTINGGEIYLGSNDGGASYAFTAYKTDYAAFIMTGGTVSGTLTALSIDAWGKSVNLTVSGGTFSVAPLDYVAEGYEAVEKDGIWTVVAKA